MPCAPAPRARGSVVVQQQQGWALPRPHGPAWLGTAARPRRRPWPTHHGRPAAVQWGAEAEGQQQLKEQEGVQAPAPATFDAAAHSLQRRLTEAVQAEQAEQLAQLRRLYKETPLAQLRSEGVLLDQLAATPQGRMYADSVWRFAPRGAGGGDAQQGSTAQQQGKAAAQQQQQQALPNHRFQRGDAVGLELDPSTTAGSSSSSRSGKAQQQGEPEGGRLEGTVLEVAPGHLLLSLGREASALLLEAGPGERKLVGWVRCAGAPGRRHAGADLLA